jgi:hypothetical protein
MKLFESAGLSDEGEQFRGLNKSSTLELFLKGVIFAIPIFFGFLLFSFILVNEMSKLTGKVKDALNPYKEESVKSRVGFKRTIERYRPYVHEALLMLEEEKENVKVLKK